MNTKTSFKGLSVLLLLAVSAVSARNVPCGVFYVSVCFHYRLEIVAAAGAVTDCLPRLSSSRHGNRLFSVLVVRFIY